MSRLRKALLYTAIALALLVALGLAMIHRSGAWSLVFPSEQHDTTPPEIPADFGEGKALRVLVFSKTNSFRHDDGIAGARRALDAIAERNGLALFHSENGALFNASELERFDVVVFSNASGNMLSDEQDRAFEKWLEAGGGWIGTPRRGRPLPCGLDLVQGEPHRRPISSATSWDRRPRRRASSSRTAPIP